MTSPYYVTEEDEEPERPWMGMALLLSIPLLSLILVRLLWSGSSFWFLVAGIMFLGGAAALFLTRRNDEHGPITLADEPNRLPLALMGIGMVFVALLLLPNFSGDGDAIAPIEQVQNAAPLVTQRSVVAQPTLRTQPTARPTVAPTPTPDTSAEVVVEEPVVVPADEEEVAVEPPPGSETYVVEDGDTLWDIALDYGVSVEDILAANSLESPDDIQAGEELAIPPATEDDSSAAGAEE
jgi:LysM repeat protein